MSRPALDAAPERPLSEIVDDAIAVIATIPGIFVFKRMLVRVTRERKYQVVGVRALRDAILEHADVSHPWRLRSEPSDVLHEVIARGEYPGMTQIEPCRPNQVVTGPRALLDALPSGFAPRHLRAARALLATGAEAEAVRLYGLSRAALDAITSGRLGAGRREPRPGHYTGT